MPETTFWLATTAADSSCPCGTIRPAMISAFFVPSIGVIIPISSPSRRSPVPIITSRGIITPVVIIVVAVIGLSVRIGQNDQRAPCWHHDLRETLRNTKACKQDKPTLHPTSMNGPHAHSMPFHFASSLRDARTHPVRFQRNRPFVWRDLDSLRPMAFVVSPPGGLICALHAPAMRLLRLVPIHLP